MSCFRHLLIAAVVPLALIASPALGVPWHLDAIDSRNLPLDNAYTPSTGNRGLGYTVWIVSTGINDRHVEFGGRAQQVANFGTGPNEDTVGHGTWLASLAGGETYGVAPHVQLRGVKVTDECGRTTVDAIISGLEYVQSNADGSSVAVVGFAFETLTDEERIRVNTAVNNLVNSGVPTAVPAGDVAIDACEFSPASASEAVTVGGLDTSLEPTSWSAYGTCIEIYAPGENMTGAWHSSDTATNTLGSTAGSAALVAGALALYGKDVRALLANATPMGQGRIRLYV